MCNQFHLPNLAEISHYLKSDLNLPLVQPNFSSEAKDIYPNEKAPVLLYEDNKLQLIEKVWGYPSPKDSKPLFNARIERFYQNKPSMWDSSFAKRRCLIIASAFYESSRERYYGENGHLYHQRYSFSSPNQQLTLIAGIYKKDHFAMVTTEPNKIMRPIHQRMPLVIEPNELRRWLFQNFTPLIDRSQTPLKANKMPRKN